MVYRSGQIFLPFCHNTRVRQTDGRTDGQTDRILIARPRLHCMQRGKNYKLHRFTTSENVAKQTHTVQYDSSHTGHKTWLEVKSAILVIWKETVTLNFTCVTSQNLKCVSTAITKLDKTNFCTVSLTANDNLPQWWVSSRSFIIRANSAGSTFMRESNRSRTSLTELRRRSSTEPEAWSDATRSKYMDDARPEPYENKTTVLFAMSAAE